MKLQIKYNIPDFDNALEIAKHTAEFADIIEIGSLLIYQKGALAVSTFKETFPNKPIYTDAKIADKGDHATKIFSNVGSTYLSVVAGTHYTTIQKSTAQAKKEGIRIVLDFINADSLGQSAHEAKTLGAYGILLHRRVDGDQVELQNIWYQVRDNTDLPIFIEGKINKKILTQIIPLDPEVIVIGSAITTSDNPRKEAHDLKTLLTSNT